MKHHFIIEDEVFELIMGLRTRQRETLLGALKLLADQAPTPGEFAYRDAGRHAIQTKVIRRWKIWFWYDGPVNEVRVVDIEKV